MPTPTPPPGPRLSRRGFLAGLTGLTGAALVGCTRQGETDRPALAGQTAPPADSVDPDIALAAEALTSQEQVLELLEATSKRHRGLSEVLAPVIAAHKAHADVLRHAVPRRASTSPSPEASATSDATPGRDEVPGRQAQALTRVVEAEQRLVTVVKRQAFGAESGAFARLLASMGAASAQYATVLTRSSTQGSGS